MASGWSGYSLFYIYKTLWQILKNAVSVKGFYVILFTVYFVFFFIPPTRRLVIIPTIKAAASGVMLRSAPSVIELLPNPKNNPPIPVTRIEATTKRFLLSFKSTF